MSVLRLSLAGLLLVSPAAPVLAQGLDGAYVQSLLSKYDINADGWLSGNELEACGCGHFDLDRDGKVALAEFAGGIIIHGEASLAQAQPSSGPQAAQDGPPPENSTAQQEAAHEEAAQGAVATATFVNSPEGLAGGLAENFVPFAFEYPASWELVETGREPDTSNFVKVEREVDGFTAENFAVGYLTLPPSADSDPEEMNRKLNEVMEALQGMLAGGFPEFRPIMMGPAQLGAREGRYLTFSSHVKDSPRGPLDIWGRTLLIPAGNGRGIVALMLGTEVGTDLRGPADLGRKGELPVILNSFRFGEGE